MTLNEINSQPIEWMNQYNILWYLKSARWWLAFWLGEYSNLGLSQRYQASNGRDGEDDACCQAFYEQTRPPLRSSSASASRSSTAPKSCCFYLLCPLISNINININIVSQGGYLPPCLGSGLVIRLKTAFTFCLEVLLKQIKIAWSLLNWLSMLVVRSRTLYTQRFPPRELVVGNLASLSFFLFILFIFIFLFRMASLSLSSAKVLERREFEPYSLHSFFLII